MRHASEGEADCGLGTRLPGAPDGGQMLPSIDPTSLAMPQVARRADAGSKLGPELPAAGGSGAAHGAARTARRGGEKEKK